MTAIDERQNRETIMNQEAKLASSRPPTDIKRVLEEEIKEYHFHIYFHQKNEDEHKEALTLRDAVLKLRRAGAFVAVPLWRVNEWPMGPHPVGSYEIWCPTESFASVFSYLCQHHGSLSAIVLTGFSWRSDSPSHERRGCEFRSDAFSSSISFRIGISDHSGRSAWIGPPFPLDLSTLPILSENIPLQYPSLGLGYSSTADGPSIEDRKEAGEEVEKTLEQEPEAAPAPSHSKI